MLIDFRQILVLVLIFVPLQLLLPLRPDQRIFRKHWLNDTVYLLGNGLIIRAGVVVALGVLLATVQPLVPAAITGFVGGQPLWLQAIGAIVVADIGFYAHHRLFHAVPFLWRFHAVHHSIEELDWLAAHRVHPVDQIVSSTFSLLPLLLLGFSAPAIAIYAFTYLLQSHLVHANVRLDFGPLRGVIASPHYHHWHHANDPGAHDRNFSAQLTFMDRLFGTLHMPAGTPHRYGTDDPVPAIYPLQLLWPFTRPERPDAATTTPAAEPQP